MLLSQLLGLGFWGLFSQGFVVSPRLYAVWGMWHIAGAIRKGSWKDTVP